MPAFKKNDGKDMVIRFSDNNKEPVRKPENWRKKNKLYLKNCQKVGIYLNSTLKRPDQAF